MVAGVLHDSVAEVIYHRRDGKDATQRFVDTFLLRMDFSRPKRRVEVDPKRKWSAPYFRCFYEPRQNDANDPNRTSQYLVSH